DRFFAGQNLITARAEALFGPLSVHSPVHLMVTLPSEAAADPTLCEQLARMGVEAVRINCAHDDREGWARMIAHVDQAAGTTGRRMKVLMDLAGPKIRTGRFRDLKGLKRVLTGDVLAITRPGRLDEAPPGMPAIECSLAMPIDALRAGHRVFVDDGQLRTTTLAPEPWGARLQVEAAPADKGYKLKPEKGINFPDSALDIPALTEADEEALRFAAAHADGVEFSFVQHPADVERLQHVLAQAQPDTWRRFGLVLKIETERAVRNLPDLIVRAAGRQPTAVMIARGDLAVEIGYARLAEMQEEILWLCEAAHVPVIWATQVLENFLKTGVPTRGEMTDAAMGARAECVMLNKGPHLFEVITQLEHLFERMVTHMNKKTPQLRPLKSW
ncbi:MAG: pyruvate kinase, partial [Paracoccaceae bacterium]|nr:pyruvate kinase [Paracoccaceae bacterium]